VLTGAGISAESGVPTFRGPAGLWRRFKPEDLATPEAFARDPKLCWEWYNWRRGLIAAVEPNAGHAAIAALEAQRARSGRERRSGTRAASTGPFCGCSFERRTPSFTLITQNVDGLHQRAGSKNVLEIHGSIWLLRCTLCGREWRDLSPSLPILPLCECGGLARPGVVWFGENLNPKIWAAAEQAATVCDVILVVGTSAVVYPAAGLVPLARLAGAKIVEVNIEATPLSQSVDYAFRQAAGAILPELLELAT
jgi:NAD-dependent deacetylase